MRIRARWFDGIPLAALGCFGLALWPTVPRGISSCAGSTLCFVLTGVALAYAIAPGRIGPIARLVAIAACSLGTGIAGGLALNAVPAGIVQLNWLRFGLAVSLVGYTIGRIRGAGRPPSWSPQPSYSFAWRPLLKVLAAAVMVAAAVWVTVSGANNREKQFTELWLVPDGPEHSPVQASSAALGVRSHEGSKQDFTLVVDTGEQRLTKQLTLAPDETWTESVSIDSATASASLYRGSSVSGEPYRTVWLVTS